MTNSEQSINDALAMVDTFRERAVNAEWELRRLKRAICKWKPSSVIISSIDEERSFITVVIAGAFPTEQAFRIAEKLGHNQF